MKKLIVIFSAVLFSLSFQSCRETVPPETLEDSETTTEESENEVDLGNYDDEDSEENR